MEKMQIIQRKWGYTDFLFYVFLIASAVIAELYGGKNDGDGSFSIINALVRFWYVFLPLLMLDFIVRPIINKKYGKSNPKD
jgi:hypothetical protein